jgi:hypothetical protein
MSWKRDRDSLIAQTMAFVQSVTGRREEAGRTGVLSMPSSAGVAVLDAPGSELTLPKPRSKVTEEPVRAAPPPLPPVAAAAITRSTVQGEMANEIRARIASFRAHQERFNREREEYFTQTLAKLRAAIKDAPPPRTNK